MMTFFSIKSQYFNYLMPQKLSEVAVPCTQHSEESLVAKCYMIIYTKR